MKEKLTKYKAGENVLLCNGNMRQIKMAYSAPEKVGATTYEVIDSKGQTSFVTEEEICLELNMKMVKSPEFSSSLLKSSLIMNELKTNLTKMSTLYTEVSSKPDEMSEFINEKVEIINELIGDFEWAMKLYE